MPMPPEVHTLYVGDVFGESQVIAWRCVRLAGDMFGPILIYQPDDLPRTITADRLQSIEDTVRNYLVQTYAREGRYVRVEFWNSTVGGGEGEWQALPMAYGDVPQWTQTTATYTTTETYQAFYHAQPRIVDWSAVQPTYQMGFYQEYGQPESPWQDPRRIEAQSRARELLLENLTPDERAEFEATAAVTVTVTMGIFRVHHRTFRLHLGRIANIQEIDSDGDHKATYCAHVSDDVPNEDNLLAQILMLKSRPDEFMKVARKMK